MVAGLHCRGKVRAYFSMRQEKPLLSLENTTKGVGEGIEKIKKITW